MPVSIYWGEDEFAIAKAVKKLQTDLLDPSWIQFNYHQFEDNQPEIMISALNEVLTPPFGMGAKLVWVQNANAHLQCSADLLSELTTTLPIIPENGYLLLTSNKKPDGRLKSSKLFKEFGKIKEFSLIPYWNERAIEENIHQIAVEINIKLSASAVKVLREFLGNDTRSLWNELEKLSIYNHYNANKIIDADAVNKLVICNTQNSIKLAEAIRSCHLETALSLVNDLLIRNEPALKIMATLVRQFRDWTMVKVFWESGEQNFSVIAKIAEIPGNPNRLKYMLNDLKHLSAQQLLSIFPLLVDLEYQLKRGANQKEILQTKIIEIWQLLQ